MNYPANVQRAIKRAAHLNTLLCNVGLTLEVLIPMDNPEGGEMLWSLDWLGATTLPYSYGTYAHERSALRAAWRLYRQRTGH